MKTETVNDDQQLEVEDLTQTNKKMKVTRSETPQHHIERDWKFKDQSRV